MKVQYIQAVGKRKSAVARAFIKGGSGKITVNGKDYEQYFGRETSRMIVRQPLEATEKLGKIDVMINVCGSGLASQAGAVRHAIARALNKMDIELRPKLKVRGLLTRDAREVERKKYGRHKARRRPQYSKR